LSVQEIGSAASGLREPKESRRWLKPRVPKEQLYRLAPARPKPKRLGGAILDFPGWVRRVIRTWWIWLALALLSWQMGFWAAALVAGALSFVCYHLSPNAHPVVYALEPDFDAASAEFRTTMAGMTGMPWVDGNRVAIYNNGDEFYPAMLDAIDSAKHSVTMEQFIYWGGEIGQRFAEAFAEKACQGIPVKLLVDAVGSSTLGERVIRILETGGCQLAWFRPIHWYTLDRANLRTHRKSLIVDGQVAFTGGAGLADHWLGTATNKYEWRDIQIRVEGPAVWEQQAGFAQNWLLTTGEILSGHDFFPVIEPAGSVALQTILSSPSTGAAAAGTMHLIALQCASDYLYIANPYFIPDSRVIDLLAGACGRGVSVKLMVAGVHNDTWWARQNSLRLYGRLMESGVEIYEYQPTMLHQKIMIVDGAWGTVGTANFDNRSFALSEETNVCFHDPLLVDELRRTFLADLTQSRKVELSDWRHRGAWQKAKEQFASLIEDQV